MVESLLKAQIEGLAFTLSPRNRSVVLDIIKRRVKVANLDLVEQDFKEIVREFEAETNSMKAASSTKCTRPMG
jgi:hypothetical protein